jgi:hypothetical protein
MHTPSADLADISKQHMQVTPNQRRNFCQSQEKENQVKCELPLIFR